MIETRTRRGSTHITAQQIGLDPDLNTLVERAIPSGAEFKSMLNHGNPTGPAGIEVFWETPRVHRTKLNRRASRARGIPHAAPRVWTIREKR